MASAPDRETALGPKFCPGLALPFFSGFLVLQPPLVLQPAALFIGALAFDHERLKPGLSISLTGKGSEVFAGLAGVFLILRLSLHCADHIPHQHGRESLQSAGQGIISLKGPTISSQLDDIRLRAPHLA